MSLARRTQSTRSRESESHADADLELLAKTEHLHAVYKHALLVLLANLAGSATLTAGLWMVVPQDRLMAWLAVLLLFNVFRWLQARRQAAKPPEAADLPKLELRLLLGTLASGLLWGSAAVLFYVPNQPAHSMFLTLILVAMTAGSTALLSFHRLAYPVFCAPVVLPLAIQLGTEGGAPQAAVALVIPVYFSLLFVLSRQIYRFSHQAIITALTRERHALADHLTAIPNRRAFEEFLEKEWLRGVRTRRPLTLIVSDIDDFKSYNDRLGHAVGDTVLRAVASLFRQAARRGTDLAARIGGDEFAIIAAETDRLGASSIVVNIERAREVLAHDKLKDWPFPTLSFGFCTVTPSDSGSAFLLFEEADAALYRAKAEGRHRTAECSAQ